MNYVMNNSIEIVKLLFEYYQVLKRAGAGARPKSASGSASASASLRVSDERERAHFLVSDFEHWINIKYVKFWNLPDIRNTRV